MKRNILNLEGIVVLNTEQQKKISGGTLIRERDDDNHCQNFTEVVPTGCPCVSGFGCARTYHLDGFSREGVCQGGFCA